MIPKIIHRVWIYDDLPDPNTDLGRCFYSQEKLKDYGYEIRTYTSKNFDFSISKYLLQAYSLKKWAFVADYIRLWALYNFGGIYIDCDVEIIKSFDELLPCKYFCGAKYKSWEDKGNDHGKNFPAESGLHHGNDFLFDAGVFGAEKNNYIIKLLYDYYNNYNFIEHNGYIHDKNWNHPNYYPDYIEYKINDILTNYNYNKIGFIDNINEYIDNVNSSDIKKDIYILNTAFLGDCNYKKHTDDNQDCICVHYGIGSWVNESPVYFHDYPLYKQIEYYQRFNENKLTNLSNKTYILTINNDNIKTINNQFNITNENQIINDLNNIYDNNYILINYDNITNISLFKYLLKNLPNNSCIISNEYNIENSNNTSKQYIFNCLLIQNNINYKQLFNYIYKNHIWGNNKEFLYYSGIGSHNEECVNISITYINNFIKKHNIKSLLDFGCGDFNIGSKLDIDMYYGIDIVKDLIEYNKQKYEDESHKFIFNDDSYNNLPSTDLIIIKEVLQHLDNDKIKEILDHLIHITNKYILIFDTSYNDDININPNLNITNIMTLMMSKEIKNYNLHPELPPFNYDFKIIDRLRKFDNKYWNIWLYTKNENS